MATAGKEFNLDHLTVADKRQVEENRSGAVPDGGTLSWAITLFGTAVGAGILFLPIDAGSFGFVPLLLITLFIGPMVFFSHRTYARIVAASPVNDLESTKKAVAKTELITTALLVVFTMFFVWSCTLALGADGMDAAREQNIPVLSYLANETHTPFLAILSPIVALCAIASSYFGHVMGAEEGTTYLVRAVAPGFAERLDPKKLRWGIYVFIFVTTVIAGIVNPSILDLISVVGGVFITFLVYIVPMLLFRYAKDYQRYANKPETWFVFVLGVVIMGVAIWQMFAG